VDLDYLVGKLDGAVIIAVVTMMMMQSAVHDIIHMVAVRNGFVAAARSVLVSRPVAPAEVRRAAVRILRRYVEPVLVIVIAVWVVQVPVMQIVHVSVVADGRMAARGTVPVGVLIRVP
jgi:hypothetical protein